MKSRHARAVGPGSARPPLSPSVRSGRRRGRAPKRCLVLGLGLIAVLAAILPVVALSQPPRAGSRATVHVHIISSAFDPTPANIVVGDEIVWHNHDGFGHTSTSDSPGWDTGTIASLATSSPVAFGSVGTFPYHCAIHLGMTASVVVTAAGPEFGAASVIPVFALLLGVGLLLFHRTRQGGKDPL